MKMDRVWHAIPEISYFEADDNALFCAVQLSSVIVSFTANVGVIPQIEMIDEMVSATAMGVTVSVGQDQELDESVISGRTNGSNSMHLARNLINCLVTLEGMLALRSKTDEVCESAMNADHMCRLA